MRSPHSLLTTFTTLIALSCSTGGREEDISSQNIRHPTRSKSTNNPKELTLVNQGNQYARDGLFREAIETYKKALTLQPSNMLALRNYGIVLVRTGSYKNAIKNLEKTLEKFQDDFETNFYLAEAYRGENRYADAIFRYRIALRVRPDNQKALKALSWSYYKTRLYSESLATAQKLRSSFPEDEQADIIAARVLVQLKREDEALALLSRSPHSNKEHQIPYYENVKGEAALSLGKLNTAEKHYRAALKAEPLLASALFGLGRILVSRNQIDQGIEYMERAIRIMPKLTEAYLHLGRAYAAKNPKKSKQYFLRFTREAANDPEMLAYISEAKNAIASKTASSQPSEN